MRTGDRSAARARSRLAWALAAVAPVAFAVFADGGYGDAERVAFGAIALTSVAAAVAYERGDAIVPPIALPLGVLALLGAVSVTWSLAPGGRTLAWAAATAGYAAVAVAAAGAARACGVRFVAGAIALIALAAAFTGLAAALAFESPYALRRAGVWRPGGPFEYSPALALLQVSALPVLLAGMTRRSRLAAAGSAAGLALAAGVVALSASRAGLAMAVAVAGVAIARPWATVAASRAVAAAAVGLGVAAGAAIEAAAGAPTAAGATPDGSRVVVVTAVLGLAAAAWPAMRAAALRLSRDGGREVSGHAAAAAVLVAALAAGALAFGTDAGRGAGPPSDLLHGRGGTWSAAVAAWSDRPWAGAGADAFLAASARHQDGATIRFAHALPLELGVELGVAGFALALALYGCVVVSVWRVRRTASIWLLGPAALAFLGAGLVDWPWHLAGAGAVWALAAGALTGAPGLRRRPPRAGRRDAAAKSRCPQPRKDTCANFDGSQSPPRR